MSTVSRRAPAVAGQFYPRDPKRLNAMTQEYVDQSGVRPAPEQTVTIMVPHAGYIYSGPTAGFAYARVRGKQPKRVVLLGCSHRFNIETASVFDAGEFDTPLGPFPIDIAFASSLSHELDSDSVEPHMMEHSLEVQLPFLHTVLGSVPIVPVLFGSPPCDWHARAGQILARMTDPGDLVVASTDLSHYLPEEAANRIDRRSLEAVLAKDWVSFAEAVEEGSCSMCGATAVVVAMSYSLACGATAWSLLDYRTSAEVSRDFDRVVGYGAIAMERAA
ncbi:MAG: AmmeMemoRadiSam system protein B [Candidatus Hydrogenedentes bacterium]|nr:AmmeMemoRadiSam system protein B [Candidatus Hydrogenedentota bacterium]